MFTDLTVAARTYPGGRYLDLDRNATGIYEVDFNRAYQPYCYYSPPTSAAAARENRLTIPFGRRTYQSEKGRRQKLEHHASAHRVRFRRRARHSETLHFRAFVTSRRRTCDAHRIRLLRPAPGYGRCRVFRELASDRGQARSMEHIAALVTKKAARMEVLEADESVLFPGAETAVRRAAARLPLAIASGALGAEIRAFLTGPVSPLLPRHCRRRGHPPRAAGAGPISPRRALLSQPSANRSRPPTAWQSRFALGSGVAGRRTENGRRRADLRRDPAGFRPTSSSPRWTGWISRRWFRLYQLVTLRRFCAILRRKLVIVNEPVRPQLTHAVLSAIPISRGGADDRAHRAAQTRCRCVSRSARRARPGGRNGASPPSPTPTAKSRRSTSTCSRSCASSETRVQYEDLETVS